MKTKRRLRYYCDHCRKSGGSSWHMARHEGSCTANPDRVCRAHPIIAKQGAPQRPMAELKATLRGIDPLAELAALRELAGNCPVCILAALRQSGVERHDPDPEGDGPSVAYGFDFKAELKRAWDAVRAERLTPEVQP